MMKKLKYISFAITIVGINNFADKYNKNSFGILQTHTARTDKYTHAHEQAHTHINTHAHTLTRTQNVNMLFDLLTCSSWVNTYMY